MLTVSVCAPMERCTAVGQCASTPEKTVLWSRRPSYIGCETGVRVLDWDDERPEKGPGASSTTSRCASATGSRRNRTWSISPKIAAFAPMPRASVITTTAVNPGFLANDRKRETDVVAQAVHRSSPHTGMANSMPSAFRASVSDLRATPPRAGAAGGTGTSHKRTPSTARGITSPA